MEEDVVLPQTRVPDEEPLIPPVLLATVGGLRDELLGVLHVVIAPDASAEEKLRRLLESD